uniref:Uncharacterized protein n=1 Tax=Nomascus leucogenys TaxID=61853 RepID=A0A2I3HNG1_NOMLE
MGMLAPGPLQGRRPRKGHKGDSSPCCEEPCAHSYAHPGLPPHLVHKLPLSYLQTQGTYAASRRINAPLTAGSWLRLWLVTLASGVGFPQVSAWMRALPSPDCLGLRTTGEQTQKLLLKENKMKTRKSKRRSGEGSDLTTSILEQ